jgi:hypothetical protein
LIFGGNLLLGLLLRLFYFWFMLALYLLFGLTLELLFFFGLLFSKVDLIAFDIYEWGSSTNDT